MTDLLSELSAKVERKSQKSEADYRSLVDTTAKRSSKVSADAALVIIESAGHDLDTFRADVAAKEKRIRLAERIAESERCERESVSVRNQLAEIEARRAAAIAQFDSEAGPLRFRLSQLNEKISQAGDCQSQLFQSYRGPLAAEFASITAELNKLESPYQKAGRYVEESRSELSRVKAGIATDPTAWKSGSLEAAESQLRWAEHEFAPLAEKYSALTARQNEITAEMSKP